MTKVDQYGACSIAVIWVAFIEKAVSIKSSLKFNNLCSDSGSLLSDELSSLEDCTLSILTLSSIK